MDLGFTQVILDDLILRSVSYCYISKTLFPNKVTFTGFSDFRTWAYLFRGHDLPSYILINIIRAYFPIVWCKGQGEPPHPDREPSLPQPQLYMSRKSIDRAPMCGFPVSTLHESPWLRGSGIGVLRHSLLSAWPATCPVSTAAPRRKGNLFTSRKGTAHVPGSVPAHRGSILRFKPRLGENLAIGVYYPNCVCQWPIRGDGIS